MMHFLYMIAPEFVDVINTIYFAYKTAKLMAFARELWLANTRDSD